MLEKCWEYNISVNPALTDFRQAYEVCELYKEMELTRNQIQKSPVDGSCNEDVGWKGAQKNTAGYTQGRRPVGKSRGRWLDAVDRDAKKMQSNRG